METSKLISDLNTLITICKDGEQGYRTASAAVESNRTQPLFEKYAEQRNRFATELQATVSRLGGVPGTGGDLAGTIHRTWINLKAMASGRDPGALFAECRVGEEAALHVYKKVKQKELPPEIQVLVDRQYQAIKAARDRIQALETQYRQVGDENTQS